MPIERTRWKKLELEPPSWRIRRVMDRLSRERWIPGEEYRETVQHLSQKLSFGGMWTIYKAALNTTCELLGMFQGSPPAYRWDEDYGDFLRALRHKKFTGISGELKIFNLYLRRQKWKKQR